MQATLTAAPLLRNVPSSSPVAATLPVAQGDCNPSLAAEGVAGAVDSSALLQGQKAVAISHNGSVYRLQATRLGKLILTK